MLFVELNLLNGEHSFAFTCDSDLLLLTGFQHSKCSWAVSKVLVVTWSLAPEKFNLDFIFDVVVAKISASDGALVPLHALVLVCISSHLRFVDRDVLIWSSIFVNDEKVQVGLLTNERGFRAKHTNFGVCVVHQFFSRYFDESFMPWLLWENKQLFHHLVDTSNHLM